jgi:hypothetical protein
MNRQAPLNPLRPRTAELAVNDPAAKDRLPESGPRCVAADPLRPLTLESGAAELDQLTRLAPESVPLKHKVGSGKVF